ncbi:MAG: methyltransferase [Planctomycetota bacterium]
MTQTNFYLGKPKEDSPFEQEIFFDQQLTIFSPKGIRVTERLLLNQLPKIIPNSSAPLKVLILNSAEGLIPGALFFLTQKWSNPPLIHAFYSDIFNFKKAQENFQLSQISGIECSIAAEPFPDQEELFDLVLLPFQHTIEVDLAREWIVRATHLLKMKGKLWLSVDSRKKSQLEAIVHRCFKTVTLDPQRLGKIWMAEKNKKDTPPNLAGFSPYTVKEGEQILTFRSKSGVFAHGRIDQGTRALLKVLEVKPEETILDLGCGAGELGIIAALRSPNSKVVLTDASARAIQSAQLNAETLIPSRYRVVLSSDIGKEELPEKFSLILTNPPYLSHYRISQRFLESIKKLLSPEGRFYLVTKQSDWHWDTIHSNFHLETEFVLMGYSVFVATLQSPEKASALSLASSEEEEGLPLTSSEEEEEEEEVELP